MEQITQIIKDRTKMVTEMLTNHPQMRDDLPLLKQNVWERELDAMGLNPVKVDFYNLMRLQYRGKMTTEETIARTSRKVQRDNPELRGENWGKRKQKAKEVAQNINQI